MSNRLEKTHEDMIKDSAELVAKKGQEITGRMYELLFSKYPQVEKMFKDAPQGQKKILSDALALFAVNIDMLDVLKPALEKIAHSHVRTKVKPGHYPMIGQVLIQAMEEVLGEEASPEFLDAWREAYKYIGAILIDMEKELYEKEKVK